MYHSLRKHLYFFNKWGYCPICEIGSKILNDNEFNIFKYNTNCNDISILNIHNITSKILNQKHLCKNKKNENTLNNLRNDFHNFNKKHFKENGFRKIRNKQINIINKIRSSKEVYKYE